MSCSDNLCPCHDHNDERPLPERDPKAEYCFRIARYFIEDKYENVPIEGLNWMAKRIRRGIEDDLDDLESQGHIKKAVVPFLVLCFAASTALAGSLQIFTAEKTQPASISMFCGECHDGSAATLPRVNVAGSHRVDGATGMTCLSCHKSNDPKPTPWRCCECHSDICYGGSRR